VARAEARSLGLTGQAKAGSGRRRRSRSFLILRMAAFFRGKNRRVGRCEARSYIHSWGVASKLAGVLRGADVAEMS
jgi:hypothetical protein